MSKEEYSIHMLRKFVLDGFLFVGLALCLYATDNWWMPFERGFFCGDESLMFPYHNDTVTPLMLRGVGISLTVLAIVILEWLTLRKENTEHRCLGMRIPLWLQGVYCTTTSFLFGFVFVELITNIAKNVIGRPRPHFFDICQPSVDCEDSKWLGKYIQPFEFECQGLQTARFTDIRRSFLSGHSAISAYTMIFLALYLEKRASSWRGTRFLRHTLQFAVLMLSWFTSLSRVSDFKHHWSDVLAGYCTGTVLAVVFWFWCTDIISIKKKHAPIPQHDVMLSTSHQTSLSA